MILLEWFTSFSSLTHKTIIQLCISEHGLGTRALLVRNVRKSPRWFNGSWNTHKKGHADNKTSTSIVQQFKKKISKFFPFCHWKKVLHSPVRYWVTTKFRFLFSLDAVGVSSYSSQRCSTPSNPNGHDDHFGVMILDLDTFGGWGNFRWETHEFQAETHKASFGGEGRGNSWSFPFSNVNDWVCFVCEQRQSPAIVSLGECLNNPTGRTSIHPSIHWKLNCNRSKSTHDKGKVHWRKFHAEPNKGRGRKGSQKFSKSSFFPCELSANACAHNEPREWLDPTEDIHSKIVVCCAFRFGTRMKSV